VSNSKLRILYICSHKDLGGASQSALDMIDVCNDKVEPIFLLTEEGDLSAACRQRGYRYLIHDYTDLAALSAFSWKRVLVMPWRARWARYLRKDISCIKFLSKELGKSNVDIIHTNVSGCTIGAWLSRYWNKPHVWHVREALDLHFGINVCGGMNRLRKMINNAEARIPISTAIKKHWMMKDQGTFILNDAVRKAEEAVLESVKEKYFLFASFYLTEAKGVSLAVEAFCKSGVAERGYLFKLLGHSDERTRKRLVAIAEKYGCAESLEFVPFQHDVKPYYTKAKGFIQASRYEGLGRTTAEAMFFGCPVIATAYSGGTLDLIENNETGYLFNDVEECAQLISKVANNDNEEIIKRAQAFAIEHLTPENYRPKLLSVYDYLIK